MTIPRTQDIKTYKITIVKIPIKTDENCRRTNIQTEERPITNIDEAIAAITDTEEYLPRYTRRMAIKSIPINHRKNTNQASSTTIKNPTSQSSATHPETRTTPK
ncbi:hypothetical protein CHS0354_031819, partial [Potamilus streckersoni]